MIALAVKPALQQPSTPEICAAEPKGVPRGVRDKEHFQTLGIAASGERKSSAGGRGHTGKRLGLLALVEKFGGDAEN